ncbi:MAG: hypothetical protein KBT13_00200 [Bacteroidales bacterium]|uniref:hypothetical protein n=1 Tax=Sodaliphilus sp. TaxID=2815818 RepID=UPI001B5970FE|nr:hypothetical protein [Candidatus Sodaliphilus limicaballi]
MKRKVLLSLVILLTLALASCTNSGAKHIVPKSTEFVDGELAKYIEIVNESSEFYWTDDGEWSHGVIKTKLRLLDETLKGTDPASIHFKNFYTTVCLIDENGIELGTDYKRFRLNPEGTLKLKRLLTQSRKGDIIEVSFEGRTFDPDDAYAFKPVISSDIEINSSTTEYLAVNGGTKRKFDINSIDLPPQLKGKVEIIEATKELGEFNFPTVTVTFRLINKFDTNGDMIVIAGEGKDAHGVNVSELMPDCMEWRTDDRDGSKFKAFLEGTPGETITMDFAGSIENSKQIAHDLEKVAKFKLKITRQ